MQSQPKKMLIVAVLETLRKYTDKQHRLMQAPLLTLLEKDYGLKVDRKSLRHNIESLVNAGYPLKYQRGWYYKHELTPEDINILVQSLTENLSLSPETICQLISKIEAFLPVCQEKPLAGMEAEKLLMLERALACGKTVSFQESGTAYAGMKVLEIERNGKAVLKNDTDSQEDAPAPWTSWQVTVQDEALQTRVFSLSSISDVTVSE